MRFAILLLPVLLVFACQGENSPDELHLNGTKQQFQFSIAHDRDTVLYSPHGTAVHVAAHTFTEHRDGMVRLTLTEVRTKGDMIRHGLSTLTIDGQILESGGMVRITVDPEQAFQESIIAEVPAGGLDPGMQQFRGIPQGNTILWEWVDTLVNNPQLVGFARGKELYRQHCMACHAENLRTTLTGPALGNVHLYRDREWLVNFTRQSQQMILDGDSLAVCLWTQWMPVVMPDFGNVLSDSEIHSIYDFLANESRLQNIDSSEIQYVFDCDLTEITMGGVTFDTTVSYLTTNPGNSAPTPEVPQIYQLEIPANAWYNIDKFMQATQGENNLQTVENIRVHTANFNPDISCGMIVYHDQYIVLQLTQTASGEFGLWGNNIRLLDEPATILVISEKEGKLWLGETPLTIPEEQSYQVTMTEMSREEVDEIINSFE